MLSNRAARFRTGLLVLASCVAGSYALADETRADKRGAGFEWMDPAIVESSLADILPKRKAAKPTPGALDPERPLQPLRRAVTTARLAAWEDFNEETGGSWTVSWDAFNGGPGSVIALGTPSLSLGPDVETGARGLLLRHATLFGIDEPGELNLVGREDRAATYLAFARTIGGVPVEGTEIGVTTTADGRLIGVGGSWPTGLAPLRSPALTPAAALESVLGRLSLAASGLPAEFEDGTFSTVRRLKIGPDHIKPAGAAPVGRLRNSWVADAAGIQPVWVVELGLSRGSMSLEVVVDASDGAVLASRRLDTDNHEPINVYPSSPDDGPIVVRTINDANKGTGGSLDGNWVITTNDQATEIQDAPYDRTTDPNDPTVDLNFDEQQAFWSLQEANRFVVALEGDSVIGARDYGTEPVEALVHFNDVLGEGPDNSEGSFSPTLDRIQIGHGRFHVDPVRGLRDGALEPDFWMHEYGHRVGRDITDWGATDSAGAMNEGFADYLAFAFTNDHYLGEFQLPEPENGHESGGGCCFNGFFRSALNTRTYSDVCDNTGVDPTGLTCRPAPDDNQCCEEHSDGEIYVATLWDVRLAFINAEGFADGSAQADQVAYDHVKGLASQGLEDFIKGRDQMLAADQALNGGAHECLIWHAFAAREIGDGADNALPVPTTSTAVPAQCQNVAEIRFDQGSYHCGAGQQARVEIDDANGGTVTTVTVTTDSGDSETFALSWGGGSAQTAFFDIDVGGATSAGNGTVEVTGAGDTIRASFDDDAPVRTVTAGADIDCELNVKLRTWRFVGGSCDGDDPFLDSGESATLEIVLENREVRSTVEGAALTVTSDNPSIAVNDPTAHVVSGLAPGDDIVLRFSLSAGALSAQDPVTFTVNATGSAYSAGILTPGSETSISFGDVLEADINVVENSETWNFDTDPGANPVSCPSIDQGRTEWCTRSNGSTGTETWNWYDATCDPRPGAVGTSGGYWLSGTSPGTKCSGGNPSQRWVPEYAASDSSWASSPWIRIHDADTRFPSTPTRIEWRHNIEFGDEAAYAPFIFGDRFYKQGQLSQITARFDTDDNTVGWEDADPDADGQPGAPVILSNFGRPQLELDNGALQVWFLFTGDDGALPDPTLNGEDGVYIDDVSFFWDEQQIGNDATSSCPAADSSLSLVSHAFDDTDPSGGNANGVLDPGETVELQVRLLGGGTESSRNIVGNLTSDQPGLLTIGDGQATWPAIVPGIERTSDAPHFEVTVDPSTPCGTIFRMTLSLDHNGVAGKSVVSFPLRVGVFAPDANAFVTEDFESGPAGWTVNADGTDTATTGIWELVDPILVCYDDTYDAISGTYSQDCGQSVPGMNPPAARDYHKTVTPGDDDNPGTPSGFAWITENTDLMENYNLNDVDGGETSIQSSDYDLSSLNDPIVSFARHYYSREGTPADALDVEMSTDGGSNWITLESHFGRYGVFSEDDGDPTDFDDGPLDGGWTTRSFNLLDLNLPWTSTTRFRVRVRDTEGQIVEAGFDDLDIRENVGGSCTPFAGGGNTPGEASKAGAAQMLVTGYDGGTGDITISYAPACSATDHTVVYGDLANVSTYGWSGQECAAGTSGSVTFNPALSDAFWVIVANDGTVEGSYGEDGSGAQRPEASGLPGCDYAQDLSNTCD